MQHSGTDQRASQKALSAAIEVLHSAIEGLFRQQHEFTRRHNQSADVLRDTASVLASRRPTRRTSGTDETHQLPCRRARPS